MHLDVWPALPWEECEACTVVVRASVPSGPSSAEGIAKDNFTNDDGLPVRPPAISAISSSPAHHSVTLTER